MPLCKEHGQVFGEGGACIVCSGGEPHHDDYNAPVVMSKQSMNVYEQALEDLNAQLAELKQEVAALKAKIG